MAWFKSNKNEAILPLTLDIGERIVLHSLEGAPPWRIEGTVAYTDGAVMGARVSNIDAVPSEGALSVEWTVAGDARYRVHAKIEGATFDRVILRTTRPPERWQERAEYRLWVGEVAVTLTTSAGEHREAVARDISAGGLLLEVPEPMAVGERVWCTFTLPGGKEECEAAAEVVRSKRQGSKEHAGLCFVEFGDEGRARIARTIFAEQARRRMSKADDSDRPL